MHIPEKPKDHGSKTFAEFCIKNKHHNKDGIRCDNCGGSGRVIADYERPDPVEGYKMADRVNCSMCLATGVMSEEIAKSLWKKERLYYKQKMLDYKSEMNMIKEIISKLPKEASEYLFPELKHKKKKKVYK